jgi:hypothetical protein
MPGKLGSARSSRYAKERYRVHRGEAEGARYEVDIPPACRNHRIPASPDTQVSCTAACRLCAPRSEGDTHLGLHCDI